eukprot:2451648-Amphidinium_carterae.2
MIRPSVFLVVVSRSVPQVLIRQSTTPLASVPTWSIFSCGNSASPDARVEISVSPGHPVVDSQGNLPLLRPVPPPRSCIAVDAGVAAKGLCTHGHPPLRSHKGV